MDPARSTSGHAKGAVVDGSALVSSANWSSAGLGANWEAALHIEHPGAAAYYAGAWRRDWETAVGLDV
jgi:phosphatidylserine/phosphatidylglycerophosphate/cardiolipin synthase-like enzyme